MEKIGEIDKLSDKMKEYPSILISIDYIPVDNKIVKNFYKKRILEMFIIHFHNLHKTLHN